jgi:hypothetical protein
MATGRLGLHINSKSIRPSPPFYPCTPQQYFVPAHQADKARDPKLGSSVRLLELLRMERIFASKTSTEDYQEETEASCWRNAIFIWGLAKHRVVDEGSTIKSGSQWRLRDTS